MQQLNATFEDSGKLIMSELTFFNRLTSQNLRKQEAIIIADQMDNIFRNGRGAKYDESTERGSVISSIVELLTDENKTVGDLAARIDDHYLFWGEEK